MADPATFVIGTDAITTRQIASGGGVQAQINALAADIDAVAASASGPSLPTFVGKLAEAAVELGVYSASVIGTLWQDTARTVPVTQVGDPVWAVDDRSPRATHLEGRVVTGTAPPATYQIDARGYPYLAITSAGYFVADMPLFEAARTLIAPAFIALSARFDPQPSRILFALGDGNADALAMVCQNSSVTPTPGVAVVARSTGQTTMEIATRAGGHSFADPFVMDGYLTEADFSSWHEGAGRNVAAARFAGGWNRIPTTWPAGHSEAGGTIAIAGTGAGSSNGALDFYGGVVAQGPISARSRAQVSDWLQQLNGSADLLAGDFDLFAGSGQSNRLGQGDYATSEMVSNEGLFFLDNGAFRRGNDPMPAGRGGASNTGGWGPAFLREWFVRTRNKAIITNTAVSGAGLITSFAGATWAADGDLLQRMVEDKDAARMAAASRGMRVTLRGILYQGGENDAPVADTLDADPTVAATLYAAEIAAFRDRIWAQLPTRPPLLLSQVEGHAQGTDAAGYAVIQAAFIEAADSYDGIHLVRPVQGFVADGHMRDNVHWSQSGLNLVFRV